MPNDPSRVALFIDYQNVYRRALAAFHGDRGHGADGQISPRELGEVLCQRAQLPGSRLLSEVRLYTGIPSQRRDRQGYAARRRQIAEWRRQGIIVSQRPLRYRPGEQPQEKGIDVKLAIDFVTGAVEKRFDVGILFSTDTDLLPALEFLVEHPDLGITPEVAVWRGTGDNNPPLSVPHASIWHHRLTQDDYEQVRDRRRYDRG